MLLRMLLTRCKIIRMLLYREMFKNYLHNLVLKLRIKIFTGVPMYTYSPLM